MIILVGIIAVQTFIEAEFHDTYEAAGFPERRCRDVETLVFSARIHPFRPDVPAVNLCGVIATS